MPEFILDRGSPEASRKFSEQSYFVQGYIEAMFFTNTGTGDDEELENVTVADLSEDAWSSIIQDCESFQVDANELLKQAYQQNYDETQAGRDFWFTRNGHGVGFWDRKELERMPINYVEPIDTIGDALSEIASRYGEESLYLGDDNRLYVS